MTEEEEQAFNLRLAVALLDINCKSIMLKNHVKALESINVLMELLTIADFHEVESFLEAKVRPSLSRGLKEFFMPKYFKLENMVKNSKNIYLATSTKQNSEEVGLLRDILVHILKRIRLLDELEAKFIRCLYLINIVSKKNLAKTYLYLLKNHKKDIYDSLQNSFNKQRAIDKEQGLKPRKLDELLSKYCDAIFTEDELETLQESCYKLKKYMLLNEFKDIIDNRLL